MSELREKLFFEQKNGYDLIGTDERIKVEQYCQEYMDFLDNSRMEREAVRNAVALAKEHGFVEFVPGMDIKPGMKLYKNNRGKALMLAVIGKRPLSEGAVIAGAHVDSPRLDLKQVTMYESDEMCYFKTHYYGGIKKYQWVTIPLELHGAVVLKSGEVINVVIGREPGEPKFVITDLLPHLAADQMKKTMAEGFTGEGLNIGSAPYADDGKDRVKLAVMSLLNDMYGITEEDFLSAELAAVPAFDVCEIGLDRSLIGGYGHDDRVCAFAELKAIFDVEAPEDLCAAQGAELRRCYEKSFCISADVTNAYDPLYPDVSEKRSDAKINYGVGICKFTGARGKSGTSDASAEVVAYLRRLFAENNVIWQLAELGKVDQGGGGTIAKFMANRNIDTIDAGVPVLSMHAPFEVVAKLDCYMTYKACLAAYSDK